MLLGSIRETPTLVCMDYTYYIPLHLKISSKDIIIPYNIPITCIPIAHIPITFSPIAHIPIAQRIFLLQVFIQGVQKKSAIVK